MVTVNVYTIILLISQFHTFFSLFSMCKTNSVSYFSSPHLLFPQIHTNTPTQTHSHRQINTEIHKYTYMDKPIEREREWCWYWPLMDRCWWRRSEFVGRWKWVLMLVDRAGNGDQCLWVDEVNVYRSTEISACGFWFLCGGDWCLWWRVDLTRRERIRKRKSCLWGGRWSDRWNCERKKKKKRRRDKRLVWER